MNIHKELRDFLAQNQQRLRQQDRFGDLQDGITLMPSLAEIRSLQELIIQFTIDPNEHVDLLLKNAKFLQYIPIEFIEQLTQSNQPNFFDQLIYLLSMLQYVHKGLYIIAGAISPISNFTSSILQNINISRNKLLNNYFHEGVINTSGLQNNNRDRKLNLIGIINEILTTIPCNYEDIIYAADKCVSSISSVRTDEINEYIKQSQCDLLNSVIRRIHMDIGNSTIFHHDVKLLVEIVENPFLINNVVVSFAQEMILINPNSANSGIICDSLVLLSRVCSSLNRLTAQFANKAILDRLMLYLTDFDESIKVYAINAIFQICSGISPIPIDMLLSKGLLDNLVKFAQEFPEKADQSFHVACSMCTHGPTYVQYICESEFIDLIRFVITEGIYDVQLSAIYLVSDIIRFGAIEHIRLINDPQIINTMIEFIEEDCIGTNCILFSLYKAMNPETESFDSSFKDALCTPQFLTLLQNLFESEDHTISELSNALYQRLTADSQ